MDWRVHWLEAEGDLSPWRATIAAEIEIARLAVGRLVRPRTMDVLVQRRIGTVIPETGTMGFAQGPKLFSLTVDPDNPNFARSLATGDIHRTVAHEAHHCLRIAGPGYGTTLGEALVSEGLAGHFVRCLFGSQPEAWECAVDDDTLGKHLPSAERLSDTHYDHEAWFFGAGSMPRWLGYTLGAHLVADWMATRSSIDGALWVHVPAAEVLAGAMDRSLAARVN